MRARGLKILIISVIAYFAFFAPVASANSLGSQKVFYTDSRYSYQERTVVAATVRVISEKAYFYVENSWWDSLNSYQRVRANEELKNLAIEFETNIYPGSIEFFGDVWDPGIDNDSRITILMTKLIENAGGYFDSCNMYPLGTCNRSNEREMVIINTDFLFDSKMKSFLGHELQHLINWNWKERLAGQEENVWLNEMKSEYSTTMLGYNDRYNSSILEMRVNNFLDNQHDPLAEWRGEAGDYGAITLFSHYLADQFGGNIFSLISKNALTGVIGINQSLKQAGYSDDFNTVFTNWTLANYYNNLSLGAGGKYGYTNTNLKGFRISPTISNFYSYGQISLSEKVKDWSPRWYLLGNKLKDTNNSVALKIEFASSDSKSNFKVPYMINYKNGGHELGFINETAYIFDFAKNVESVLIIPINQSKIINFTSNDPQSTFTLKASTIVIDQPVIAKISPAIGPIEGGNSISIKGGNFQEGIEVYFGGVLASEITLIDETSLSVVAPPHAPGLVNVWVKTLDGKSSVFAQGYEYGQKKISNGSLIRAQGDYKVYIVQDGYRRHILDGRIFDFYGHLNWNSIIEVTKEELESYQKSDLVRAAYDTRVYDINGDKTKHWLNMTAEEFYISGRRWGGVFIINNQERDFYQTKADVYFK